MLSHRIQCNVAFLLLISTLIFRIVKDGQWGWRALRLLAKKSPYFFTYGNNPIARLPDYLDSMLKKMSNFTPSTNASTNGTKEAGKTETSADLCTKENLSKIASNLGDEWTKLIPKLGLSQEDAEKFTKDGKTSQGKFIYQESFSYVSRDQNFTVRFTTLVSEILLTSFFRQATKVAKIVLLMHIFPLKTF